MMGSFAEMEKRVRRALALPAGWKVEPAGACQDDQCSELAIYPTNGGYSTVSMVTLADDFEGAIGTLRKVWFPHSTEQEG